MPLTCSERYGILYFEFQTPKSVNENEKGISNPTHGQDGLAKTNKQDYK
jgi:hypothetical protein